MQSCLDHVRKNDDGHMDMESVQSVESVESVQCFEASDIPTGSKALRTSWRVLLHAARVWTRSTPGGLGDLS